MSEHTAIGRGDVVAPRNLTSVSGDTVAIPDPSRLVHLQFRRFAGCPICNLHLQSIVRRHGEIAGAGIREVVVFHSTDQELRDYVGDLPFAVIGDPSKALYAEFGVGSSPRSVLRPGALTPAVLGAGMRQGLRNTNLHPTGGHLGLPADFLIAPDGRVLADKHGRHANDQWSVDELLAQAYSANA
ncbi:alkyl hydroperoxide reductase [Mycobacterium malmoense]|uniref:peroxiredoxin-like family protein n=1 Tax=Mycobacterium malmoense TaxID=1780 RepID=UPI00080B2A70|nr:peroxiredoxin-like family protein [Mycobacterium malmoense]OCB21008.1 alkyl hydroperoxide reductase [Mycobacterium malmoense]OCB35942.1 alkyl hydroperoxide reductase [Mycobacterium malmoense]